MIIDGRKIALEILDEVSLMVKELPLPPRLTVFSCAPNFETKKFLAIKQKKATLVGIEITVIEFDEDTKLPDMISELTMADKTSDGIVVQLPFPPTIKIQTLLEKISPLKDVDVLFYDGANVEILPPVVGAIEVIAKNYQIDFFNKQVVVVGNGRLVGVPAFLYAQHKGARVELVQKNTENSSEIIKNADILILGAGVPGLLTPDLVKEGAIIFDAGTSEEGGMLVGDAEPEVVSKASLLTPVPGGIGPIAIAVLLRNLVFLTKNNRKKT